MSLRPLLKAKPQGAGADGLRLRPSRTRAAHRGQQSLLRTSARSCTKSSSWTDLRCREAATNAAVQQAKGRDAAKRSRPDVNKITVGAGPRCMRGWTAEGTSPDANAPRC